jgi:hypothetical protein
MELNELLRTLTEAGKKVELVYSTAGDPLVCINGLNPVPLPWAERLARGELSWDEMKQEFFAT